MNELKRCTDAELLVRTAHDRQAFARLYPATRCSPAWSAGSSPTERVASSNASRLIWVNHPSDPRLTFRVKPGGAGISEIAVPSPRACK
jgi:hypothetical protein